MAEISIKDIAQRAGVSVGTVDRVIHKRGNVSQKTKAKVDRAISELNYTPNLIARNLATKKSIRIAALIPLGVDDPFWEHPILGLEKGIQFIRSFGFSLELYRFDDTVEGDLLNVGMEMLSHAYDTVIIAPIIKDEAILILEACEEKQIPYVQINTLIERTSDYFLNYIGQHSYKSGALGAKLLDFGLDDGDEVLILHLEREVYNSEHLVRKERGFRDYFNAKVDKRIYIKQLSFSDVYNEDKKKNFIKYAINLHPKIKGVFITTSKVHLVLNEFNELSDSHIKFVGYDLIEPNLELLKQEKIFFLINQNSVQQGYLSIMSVFNFFMKKEDQQRIQYLPLDVVMKENMEFYTADLELIRKRQLIS